jgi:hypothetical protein
MGSIFNRKDLELTKEENQIIEEVKEYIKREYPRKPKDNIKFEVFKPLTQKWQKVNGKCTWGQNIAKSNGSFLILLTRCRDRKAFYEVVFHELYELLFNGTHEEVVPEQRKYLEEKFSIKLGYREWSPLDDEIIQTLYPSEKERLKNTFANMLEPFRRTWQEIEQRAKELGLMHAC